MKTKGMARRPLKTRERPWARALARWLAARGIRPNAVSLASVLFAALSGIFFFLSLEESGDTCGPYLVAAAVFIQLRLLCNMLDGLIAVEGGLAGPLGDIYNDLPDRIADSLILIGAGLAVRQMAWGVTLGWLAALLAMLTAYVRLLGGSLGLEQSFAGPMAKQHRMFVLTLGSIAACVEIALGRHPRLLWAALAVVVAGSALTAILRTARIARELKSR